MGNGFSLSRFPCCNGAKPNPLAIPGSKAPPVPKVTPRRLLDHQVDLYQDTVRQGENLYVPFSTDGGDRARGDWEFRNLTAEALDDNDKSIFATAHKEHTQIFRDKDGHILAVLAYPKDGENYVAWLLLPKPIVKGQLPFRDFLVGGRRLYVYLEFNKKCCKQVCGQSIVAKGEINCSKTTLWETTHYSRYACELTSDYLVVTMLIRNARDNIRSALHAMPDPDKCKLRCQPGVDPVVFFSVRLAYRSFMVLDGIGHNMHRWDR